MNVPILGRSVMLRHYARLMATVVVGWFLFAIAATQLCRGIELRRIQDGSLAGAGDAIPKDAVNVFVYAGQPRNVKVNENNVAADYGRCGVLFGRSSGEITGRLTVAQGWPANRPDDFVQATASPADSPLIGPGILRKWGGRRGDREDQRQSFEEACSVEFQGHTWRAYQPADFLRYIQTEGYKDRKGPYSGWSGILARLNEQSYLVGRAAGQRPRRYTMSDGLASNIVTRLVPCQGCLWAGCVDIYEPDKNRWGPGGLSQFDPNTSQWETIEAIEGHPVRWVTLLQTVGDELWVGFREGSGVAGDKVYYGMGVGADIYRPKATAMILARFAAGKWTVFVRPLPATGNGPADQGREDAPTEMPLELARYGTRVFLFSGSRSHGHSYNFEYKLDGRVSLLDIGAGKWREFDPYEHFDADRLIRMVADKGEILVTSNRGVHRWDDKKQTWRFLDPQAELKNPMLSAAVSRGNEFWVGYTNQSFGVVGQQGISVFDEDTLQWSYMSPERIGTACPVRRMAVTPDGDVWVLFEPRPYRGAAMEYAYYPRETKTARPWGLGCFSKGRWKFPVQLPEPAQPIDGPDYPWNHRGAHELVAVGDKVFVAASEGVYLGPGQWRRIVEGQVFSIELADDAKSLTLLRQGPREEQGPQTIQRGRYDLATGECPFETAPGDEARRWEFESRSCLWEQDLTESGHTRPWTGDWVLLSAWKDGNWAIGPLGGDTPHAVVETPHAFWIASQGELVRLDRKLMEQ
ncbi:MAG TPA: hypothetical protein VMX13_17520 [Sedimentisphaerales bacterium]|nr:hypothetical protein [Sedimentisphaerales bacterium]